MADYDIVNDFLVGLVGLGIIFGSFGIVGFIGWLLEEREKRFYKKMNEHANEHCQKFMKYCRICGVNLR